MPSLIKMLLATVMLSAGIAFASPTYGNGEQKPEHEDRPQGTPGCGKHHSHDDQLKTVTLPTHNGEREFSIYIPASYNKHQATAVIMSYHGQDMNSAEDALISGLNDSRVNPDMIAVFPQAIDCVWEGTPAKPVDDLQFTRHMIYYLQENFCIDNNRLYATGFDIGGGFIDDIACSKDTGDYFAAFAMVSPALIGKGLYQKHRAPHCSPSRPHPMLQIYPTHDQDNYHVVGETKDEARVMPYYPGPEFLREWAEVDECDEIPDTCSLHSRQVNTTSYTCHGINGFVLGVEVGHVMNRFTSPEGSEGAHMEMNKGIVDFLKEKSKGLA